jgi:hypothetical protein
MCDHSHLCFDSTADGTVDVLVAMGGAKYIDCCCPTDLFVLFCSHDGPCILISSM